MGASRETPEDEQAAPAGAVAANAVTAAMPAIRRKRRQATGKDVLTRGSPARRLRISA